MALFPTVVPATRTGKAVLAATLISACAGFIASPLVRGQHADDDAPASSVPSAADHDADTLRAAHTNVASNVAAPSNDARSPVTADASPATPAGPSVESVTVDSSFAEAMQRLGVNAAVTTLIAHSFGNQIDFQRDLRKGDTVGVVMRAGSGTNATQNEPLAVRVSRGDTDYDVFLHRDLNGKPFYYPADGLSGKSAFSRYPLRFTRVSSDFSARRLDPVTHRWQSHDGVDLAAPVGTPVHATARGTISFIGRQTGYGNFIVIDNMPPYQTAFAHLSRFAKGLHRGSHVRRGQVIGYVGRTGWTTGPHLHYEVRVNHIARNPLTVMLPNGPGLHSNERERFAQRAKHLADLMNAG